MKTLRWIARQMTALTIKAIKWLEPTKVQTIIHISLSLLIFAVVMITRESSHHEYDVKIKSLNAELVQIRDSVAIRDSVRYREIVRLERRVEENQKIIVFLDRQYADLAQRIKAAKISEAQAVQKVNESSNKGLVNVFRGMPNED